MVHNIMHGNMFPKGTCIQGFDASLSKKKMAKGLNFKSGDKNSNLEKAKVRSNLGV